jgi:hypothetical protein
MNRRGFLKMVAGGAAAVGAAFALPRTAEGAVTAPAAQPEPVTITLPAHPGFTGMAVLGPMSNPVNIENRTFTGSKNRLAQPFSRDYWRVMRVSRAFALPINEVAAMPEWEIERRFAYSRTPDCYVHCAPSPYPWRRTINPKPSGDLVDW